MLKNIVAERVLGLPKLASRITTDMDFDFNDEQREIKSTAHEFLASRFKPEKVRELAESESPTTTRSGSEICELGWPGIAIAEEHGGQGLGVVELVILAGGARLRLRARPRCSPTPSPALRDRGRRLRRAARALAARASPRARRAAPPRLTPTDEPVVGAAEGAAVLVLDDGRRRAAGRGRRRRRSSAST